MIQYSPSMIEVGVVQSKDGIEDVVPSAYWVQYPLPIGI